MNVVSPIDYEEKRFEYLHLRIDFQYHNLKLEVHVPPISFIWFYRWCSEKFVVFAQLRVDYGIPESRIRSLRIILIESP